MPVEVSRICVRAAGALYKKVVRTAAPGGDGPRSRRGRWGGIRPQHRYVYVGRPLASPPPPLLLLLFLFTRRGANPVCMRGGFRVFHNCVVLVRHPGQGRNAFVPPGIRVFVGYIRAAIVLFRPGVWNKYNGRSLALPIRVTKTVTTQNYLTCLLMRFYHSHSFSNVFNFTASNP